MKLLCFFLPHRVGRCIGITSRSKCSDSFQVYMLYFPTEVLKYLQVCFEAANFLLTLMGKLPGMSLEAFEVCSRVLEDAEERDALLSTRCAMRECLQYCSKHSTKPSQVRNLLVLRAGACDYLHQDGCNISALPQCRSLARKSLSLNLKHQHCTPLNVFFIS